MFGALLNDECGGKYRICTSSINLPGGIDMTGKQYIKMLVEEFHSTTVATLGTDGHPQTRVIDMMLWDEQGIYFLTAKGKAFYDQLIQQKYVAISAVKNQKSISLRGKINNIGSKKLDEIFEKNTYMQKIYPKDTRSALNVFCLYEASGEFFDISDPSNVTRDSITIGEAKRKVSGYFVGSKCIGCKLCYSVCPQKCIDITSKPVVIDQNHCLHCGRCEQACPMQTIEKR